MADNIEQIINDESEYGSDSIVIRIQITNRNGIYLPVNNGEDILMACFKKLTVEDNLILEKMSYKIKTNEKGMDISSSDFLLYRYNLVRKCLLQIDNFKPERKNEWIIERDWNVVKNYNAMIMNALVLEYEQLMALTDSDEKLITRQSSILFGTENGRVMNPHPAVSGYCTLASIWDKFGINIPAMKNMYYSDYIKIKEVMNNESEQIRKAK